MKKLHIWLLILMPVFVFLMSYAMGLDNFYSEIKKSSGGEPFDLAPVLIYPLFAASITGLTAARVSVLIAMGYWLFLSVKKLQAKRAKEKIVKADVAQQE